MLWSLESILLDHILTLVPQANKKILFVSGFPTDPAQRGPTLIFFYQIFILADIPQITKLFSDWKSDNIQESYGHFSETMS